MAENIFYTKFSEISGDRFDPQMVLYKKSTNSFKYDTVALKDLLLSNPMYGANEAGSERTNKNEPRYIRITDIDEFGNLKDGMGVTAKIIENKYFLNEDDLLFARSGATVGKAYIHRKKDYDCFFAGYMIKFVVDTNKINPYFIFLYTQLDIYKKWIQAIQRAAGQPNINAEEYKSLPIPIPPTNVQQDIINIIQKAYNQKEQKEKEAQSKLDSIDKYLLNELGIEPLSNEKESLENRVFFRKFSELSGDRLDSVWQLDLKYCISGGVYENKYLHLLANVSKGQSITSSQVIQGNYPVIAGGQSSPYTHNEYNQDENAITVSASGAYSGYVWLHSYKIFASDCSVIRSKEERIVTTKYLFEILKLKQSEIYKLQKGAGQPHVYANDLEKLLIPIPPIEIQNKIANYIQNLRDEAQALKNEAIQIFEDAKKDVEKMILEEKNA